jgi:8-oxo-dGTP diphosphatase
VTIYAAGVVCWREVDNKLQVALVHREKYQDWGFPKGKQDPGELLPQTAVREVMEEAGIKVRLGRKLGVIEYLVGENENKEVHYWASKVTDKALHKQKFTPNQEIAKVEWVDAKAALSLLSYDHDQKLMADVIELHKKRELETRALIILRHAKATPRTEWKGEEAKRPLLAEGKQQAKQLSEVLAAYGPKRLVTSPWARCQATVAPYAKKEKRTLIERHQLTELATSKKPTRTLDVVMDMIGTSKSGLICTHRPALPSVLKPFANIAQKDLSTQITAGSTLDPAEFMVLRLSIHGKLRVLGVERCGSEEMTTV